MTQFKSFVFISAIFFMSCNNQAVTENEKKPVQIVTLDPGHFHAALVQKSMYPDVDSVVHVYAPEGNDLQYHLDRIKPTIVAQTMPRNGKKMSTQVTIFLKK